MNVRRGVLAAGAAWLVVVVLGSTLAWAVISRAGEGVGEPSSPATGAAPTTTADPSSTSTTTLTPDPTLTDTASTTEPASPGTPGSPVTPIRRTRTWQGLGGLVVVECVGEAVSLVGAQADSGFAVEVNDRGPDRVEVEFEGQGERDDQESRVRAFCADGTPIFEVDTDSS